MIFISLIAGAIEEIVSMAEKCGAGLHVNAFIPAGRARNHPEISLTREGNEIVYSLRVNTPRLAAKEIVGFCSEYPAACGGVIYQFLKERKKKFAHIFTGLILKEMWA